MTPAATGPAATDVAGIVAALTLEEKVRLVEGVDFWHTNPVERLGIPSLCLTDGPHGVRRVRSSAGGAFGVADNVPSTAFPTSVAIASSWDAENARRLGAAIARESVDRGVHVLLAPGVNLKRNPLCGRNFEYYSEDPLVAGVVGAAFVRGVQEEGVAASVKHFAANSNEDFRFVGDSLVDERALRELYMRQFQRIVQEAAPATVMCAYNALGGTFASANRELLTGILREEWGFDGLVMTDWGATHDRVASLAAGCDLDMPGGTGHNDAELLAAVRDGRLAEETLDVAVRRVLELVTRYGREQPAEPRSDLAAHAELARDLAIEGAVLLANDGTLPLDAAGLDGAGPRVVGELFDRLRLQGGGSSLVTPLDPDSPRQAFDARGIPYRYARGYRSLDRARDAALEREALEGVRAGETVLFFGGLGDLDESEGFDRDSMALPANQVALLEALLDAGARVVLVLFAGAPVELPFAHRLAAVLDLHLPGMRGGDATAALLFGEAAPSGRLAETWPLTASDASSAADHDRGPVARYYESVYVGYRFADAAAVPVRFPFGHGLTYTTFAYGDLEVRRTGDRIEVALDVTNTGARDGAEVVQLYVGRNDSRVFKPEKELRAFAKARIPAGATRRVRLAFELADLAYWDVADSGWRLENGEYELLVGASATDIRARAALTVTTGVESRSPYPPAVDADYATPPRDVPASFPELLGRPVPRVRRSRRLTLDTRLADARRSLLGAFVYRAVMGRVERDHRAALALTEGVERDARVTNTHFLVRMMPFSSLRSLAMSSSGALPFRVAQGIADLAAGRLIRGLRGLLARRAA